MKTNFLQFQRYVRACFINFDILDVDWVRFIYEKETLNNAILIKARKSRRARDFRGRLLITFTNCTYQQVDTGILAKISTSATSSSSSSGQRASEQAAPSPPLYMCTTTPAHFIREDFHLLLRAATFQVSIR